MDPEIEKAIGEAVAEKGDAFFAEPDAASEPVSAPGEGEPSKGQPSVEPEVSPEPTVDSLASDQGGEAEEPPTEYWGTPLDGIPPEQREAIIARFEQEESTIRKLQAELAAKDEGQPAVVEDDLPVSEPTDQELLAAAGYDPEDFEVQQMAKFIVPSLRRELALEDQLSGLVAKQQVAETKSMWNGQLDELETRYGKLPGDRLGQLKYAVDHGLASPKELYFDLSMPIRQEVGDAVRQARVEAAKRAESGGLKPTSSNAGADPVRPDMTLRESVAAAAKAAEKETGKSWGSIFRGRAPAE